MKRLAGRMKVIALLVLTFLVYTIFGQGSDILLEGHPESASLANFFQPKCGLRPFDSRYSNSPYLNENRIVNGVYASYGEFPWHVSIDWLKRHDSTAHRLQNCGASIINEFWILSAAHCFNYHRTSYLVTVGNHDWTKRDSAEQMFYVEKIINHEGYTGEHDSWDYDIALIKIKQSPNGRGIQFNDYVQPVCLPDSTTSVTAGNKCIVSGWGRTKNPAYDSMPGVLMKTEFELLNRRICQENYHQKRITTRMLCAGDFKKHSSFCNGDSGGGLVYKSRGAYTLLGVVSWGSKACSAPGVFANVLNLLPWIKSNMERYSHSYEQRMLPSRP